MLWSNLIDVARGLLFVLAHWCGGSFGLAIVLASATARLAILPLTLPAMRRNLDRARNKVTTPDPRALLDGLIQFPPAVALYSAIRAAGAAAGGFLWIANLAKPDRLLTLVAALTSAGVALTMAAPGGPRAAHLVPMIMSGLITLVVVSHLSAGVAVYSITNSLIGAVERSIAARGLRPART
jgi:membrane protein insertase Oxa1/YidC/SpoIIIJ